MLQCNEGLTRAWRKRAAILGKQAYFSCMAAMLQCKSGCLEIDRFSSQPKQRGELLHRDESERHDEQLLVLEVLQG
jgi:hypothetical protein